MKRQREQKRRSLNQGLEENTTQIPKNRWMKYANNSGNKVIPQGACPLTPSMSTSPHRRQRSVVCLYYSCTGTYIFHSSFTCLYVQVSLLSCTYITGEFTCKLQGQLSYLEFGSLTPGVLGFKFHLLHASFVFYTCSFRCKGTSNLFCHIHAMYGVPLVISVLHSQPLHFLFQNFQGQTAFLRHF